MNKNVTDKFEDLEVNNTAAIPSKINFTNGIAPLELDLGRDDLNRLVEKLNEVIRRLNK